MRRLLRLLILLLKVPGNKSLWILVSWLYDLSIFLGVEYYGKDYWY